MALTAAQRQARYRARHLERVRAIDRDHYRRNRVRLIAQKLANRDPKAHAARARAQKAVQKGLLVRGPCELAARGECLGRIEGHHDDYARPLDVRWLCRRHHELLRLAEAA